MFKINFMLEAGYLLLLIKTNKLEKNSREYVSNWISIFKQGGILKSKKDKNKERWLTTTCTKNSPK